MRQRPPRHRKKPLSRTPEAPRAAEHEHLTAHAHDHARHESARENLKALHREIMRDDIIAQRESNLSSRA